PTKSASARNCPATYAAAPATSASCAQSCACCANARHRFHHRRTFMQLEQSFHIVAPADVVWQAFHDVELLVDCLPGASINGAGSATEEGAIPLLFKVKLGPIAAGFAGQGRLDLDEAARSGAIAGTAVDARSNSRVKGEAHFA